MKPVNVQNLIPAGTVLSANRTSSAQQVYNMFVCSIQVVYTGTPTGEFKLQASADAAFSGNPISGVAASPQQPKNWTDISGSTFSVTSAGSLIYNIADPGYNWVRLVYTDTSGGSSTAVIASCTFNGKGF